MSIFLAMSLDKNTNYCRDMVERDDRERYETVLFAPSWAQKPLWVLYAFNQEIAKTRENVSEAALGEIRLQWWRDALSELRGGNVREHPVVEAMQQLSLPETLLTILDGLIDAREQDLYDDGPADQDALEEYAKAVGGKLAEAALRMSLNKEPETESLVLANSTGAAWAMLGLVRAIPFHWAANRNYVPGEKGLAALATTDADKMFDLAEPSIKKMIDFSQRHLVDMKSKNQHVPTEAGHVFLSNTQLRLHLTALKRASGNPFKCEHPGSFRRLTSMIWSSLFGSYH